MVWMFLTFSVPKANVQRITGRTVFEMSHFFVFEDEFQQFWNFVGWQLNKIQKAKMHITVPNFANLTNPLQRYGDFPVLKFTAVCHFGFIWDVFGHPQSVLGALYHWAKFGCNQCSFNEMKIWIFGTFGLKTPIHALKVGGLGNLTPE